MSQSAHIIDTTEQKLRAIYCQLRHTYRTHAGKIFRYSHALQIDEYKSFVRLMRSNVCAVEAFDLALIHGTSHEVSRAEIGVLAGKIAQLQSKLEWHQSSEKSLNRATRKRFVKNLELARKLGGFAKQISLAIKNFRCPIKLIDSLLLPREIREKFLRLTEKHGLQDHDELFFNLGLIAVWKTGLTAAADFFKATIGNPIVVQPAPIEKRFESLLGFLHSRQKYMSTLHKKSIRRAGKNLRSELTERFADIKIPGSRLLTRRGRCPLLAIKTLIENVEAMNSHFKSTRETSRVADLAHLTTELVAGANTSGLVEKLNTGKNDEKALEHFKHVKEFLFWASTNPRPELIFQLFENIKGYDIQGKIELAGALFRNNVSLADVKWAFSSGYFHEIAEFEIKELRKFHNSTKRFFSEPYWLDLDSISKSAHAIQNFRRLCSWLSQLPELKKDAINRLRSFLGDDLLPHGLMAANESTFQKWLDISLERALKLEQKDVDLIGKKSATIKWMQRLRTCRSHRGKNKWPKSVLKLLKRERGSESQIHALKAILKSGRTDAWMQKRLDGLKTRAVSKSRACPKKLHREAVHGHIHASSELFRSLIFEQLQSQLEGIASVKSWNLSPKRTIEFAGWYASLDSKQRAFLNLVFTEFAQHGRMYKVHLPRNRKWIKRFPEFQNSINNWLNPKKTKSKQTGESFVVDVCHKPHGAMWMGSQFDTCLSLDEGINRNSVLTCLYDINKLVIFATRHDGKIVGRKLICISDGNELLGYRTYISYDRTKEEKRRALVFELINSFCRKLAKDCELKLADDGLCENINGTFWYDDGTHAWDAPDSE